MNGYHLLKIILAMFPFDKNTAIPIRTKGYAQEYFARNYKYKSNEGLKSSVTVCSVFLQDE